MRVRRFVAALAACGIASAASGCLNVNVYTFPGPEERVATEADLEWLDGLVPQELTPEQRESWRRVVYSVGYAQEAEERLR